MCTGGAEVRVYWLTTAALLLLFSGLFVLVESLQVPMLTEATFALEGGAVAAIVALALLVGDIVLPVPSSLVMMANGRLFGPLTGTALSVLGSVGLALAGFAVGRVGGPFMARFISTEERARAERMIGRWGLVAVVVTRPLPLLAETVAIMVGAAPSMRAPAVAGAAAAGALPGAVLYACAGHFSLSLQSGFAVFGLVLAITGLFWWLGRRAVAD
jgi:uncharacterized membrane protein YdjX (TVP38/TMEM64 family)